jgi:hypothetical protein
MYRECQWRPSRRTYETGGARVLYASNRLLAFFRSGQFQSFAGVRPPPPPTPGERQRQSTNVASAADQSSYTRSLRAAFAAASPTMPTATLECWERTLPAWTKVSANLLIVSQFPPLEQLSKSRLALSGPAFFCSWSDYLSMQKITTPPFSLRTCPQISCSGYGTTTHTLHV